MPMFILAGGEIVVLILLVAVGRWIFRGWQRRRLEDESDEPSLARPIPPAPRRLHRPALRLVRGGRYQADSSSEAGGDAAAPRS